MGNPRSHLEPSSMLDATFGGIGFPTFSAVGTPCLPIIDHWGYYGELLQPWAGPGHWHDMDMLLIGNDCVTIDEQRTQMAIWSISASPLIMGNDLRQVSNESKEILLNRDAIAVNQDPLGRMGIRHPRYPSNSSTQVWYRELVGGDVAVALYNKASSGPGHADITVRLYEVGFDVDDSVSVYDIWAKQFIGDAKGHYTARAVPEHGTAFLRFSKYLLV